MNPIQKRSPGANASKKRARPEDGDNAGQSPAKIPRTEPATTTAPVFNNDRRAFKRFKVSRFINSIIVATIPSLFLVMFILPLITYDGLDICFRNFL